jgi:hypothetical protein
MNKSQLNQERRKALELEHDVVRREIFVKRDEWESIKAEHDQRHLLADKRKKAP